MLGDPAGGIFVILTTADAGKTWQPQTLPPSLPDEGAFAASNSSLAVHGSREAWFGTSGSRIFHTADGGKSWTVTQTPVRAFSLFFMDSKHGVAVGGDYTKPNDTASNAAITSDGGLTWTLPASRPRGYRSAVVCRRRVCVATGPEGSDLSRDAGRSWSPLAAPGYHALTLAGRSFFASGSGGRLGVVVSSRESCAHSSSH